MVSINNEHYFNMLASVRKYNGTLTFAKNRDELCALGLVASTKVVISWLESIDTEASIDHEMVRYGGVLCSVLQGLDASVMNWAHQSKNNSRYNIVFRFLMGFWAAGRNPSEACIDLISHLIENEFERESNIYSLGLKALYIVADPVATMTLHIDKRKILSDFLLKHLTYIDSNDIHPHIIEQLRTLKEFDHRKYFSMFDNGKNMGNYIFEEKDVPTVVDALFKWLEIWAKPGCFDQDCMWYAGRFLGMSGIPQLDKRVCQWLLTSPSLERHAVAGAFVDGYWRVTERLDKTCFMVFQDAINQLPKDSDAYNVISLAITSVTTE